MTPQTTRIERTVAHRQPFGFVAKRHPLRTALARLEESLCADGRYHALQRAMERGEPIRLRTLIREDRRVDECATLKRVYLSYQFTIDEQPVRFGANTFLYDFDKDRLAHHRFPSDRALPELVPVVAELAKRAEAAGEAADVLRYVPLKRFTFRGRWQGRDKPPVVGKLVNRDRLDELRIRLESLHAEVTRTRARFGVARPTGVDETRGILVEELRAGRDLASLLRSGNLCELLEEVGAIHAHIHCLEVPQAPPWKLSLFIAEMRQRVAWLSFVFPKQKGFFSGTLAALEVRQPAPRADYAAFCHGDFRCTNILLDEDRWSVIDFDDCVIGDPYWEIGKFLALLPYDVPSCRRGEATAGGALLRAARDAYLRGYRERSCRRLDEGAILWYWICGEIFRLARLTKRDLYQTGDLERSRAQICGLLRQLRGLGLIDSLHRP